MKKLIIFLVLLLSVLYAVYAFSGISVSGGATASGGGGGTTAEISDVSVTQTELAELETIDATTISAAQWAGLGASGTFGISVMAAADEAAFQTLITSPWADADVADNITITNASQIQDINAGTDVTADLEEETHASEHTIGGADITDRLFEGVTVAAITVGDATPPVASKGLYITTGATAITITDFYDSGDDNDGDFADGDYFGLIIEDVDVIIDFATGTNIKGNADTNLTGLASNPLLLIFVWRSGVWYCVNFNSGFSNALTMAAKIATPTPVSGATASFLGTFTGANLYGGTYIATSDDGDSVLPLMAAGMNFCIITKGAIQVVVATNANDGYLLDGVDTAEDNSVVNTSTSGDIACFQYYTADDWLITTNGWATE